MTVNQRIGYTLGWAVRATFVLLFVFASVLINEQLNGVLHAETGLAVAIGAAWGIGSLYLLLNKLRSII